jgi:phosphatidylserine/phosphatidylglycerophosphate/cardiolipin synthase-like enzyme
LLFCLLIVVAGACRVVNADDDEDDGDAGGDPAAQATAGPGGSGPGAGGGATGGTGGVEPPACDPYVQRPIPPEVLIGPTGLESALVGLMDSAQTSIDLMMYQLGSSACVNGLINAHNRGVTVRVSLDLEQYVSENSADTLQAAGIEVRDAPPAFNNAHAKVMIIDSNVAVVMSANMNIYSMSSERNYGVIDRSTEDITDLKAIFETDWSGSGSPDLSCTRLIVSPENSRERLLEFINGADQTLDMAVMYISDSAVMSAVKAKAAGGTQVRVLLAMPEWISDNTATAAELQAAGIPAKFLYTYELHAKLVIADGVALVGSQNMSYNSIENNREVGMLVTEQAPAAQIAQQFNTDWNQGVNP